MLGQIVSHYKIIRKIGEGSSGEVYKAEDLNLHRYVALKFFPAHFQADEEKRARFTREAMTASSLDHTNICTLHEIDCTDDGRLFICMAFYEGGTLARRISEGPVETGQMIDISLQIARGLMKAHSKGIVHRDIKPQNLIFTTDNTIKIVDFGLAKLIGRNDLTSDGITLGTVGYMSPQQAGGEPIDQRTDIWSLGVVMYEMMTRQLPFKGDNAQTIIYSILNREPAPIRQLCPHIHPLLEKIIDKCLSKDLSHRYTQVRSLIDDLLEVKSQLDTQPEPDSKKNKHRPTRQNRWYLIPLGILVLLLAIILSRQLQKDKLPSIHTATANSAPSPHVAAAHETLTSIMVLPFKDMSPARDREYFCDGVVEELIDALTRINGLQVFSSTASFRLKGKDIDGPALRKEYGVQNLLEGSVRISGKRVIIVARLVDTANNSLLWRHKYRENLENIFDIHEHIARQVVDALKPKLATHPETPLIKHYTDNLEAYSFYIQGRLFWGRRTPQDLDKGIKFFLKAIEVDPNYALAYVGFADSYHLLASYSILPPNQAFPAAREKAYKALAIDPRLGEAHNSLAAVLLLYDWNFPEAEKEFKLALQLNPNNHIAHEWYAIYLAVTGKLEESVEQMKLAAQISPLSTSSRVGIGRHLYFRRQFHMAIREFRAVLETDPNSFLTHAYLAQAYTMEKKFPQAIQHFKRAAQLTQPKETGALSGLAYAYALSGNRREALNILNPMLEASEMQYTPAIYIGAIYIGLGEPDRAFQWLEKAYLQRSEWMIYLGIEPMFDPIRDDPRFTNLMNKVGVPIIH